ncbi:lipopolysaccharide heptosyltransferase II [Nitratifractor sp.]|uniref:lipopolysaccharide heptosyltransferase II n=1 Tax=Nitratifractor sp. TaxID=2268144 RepID=UPI0025DB540C|nr:lipopolysaccharide heptosyltransferase II [Nitratifractor sp.]
MIRTILIEVPTWLGDCVMATPAMERLFEAYPDAEVTLFGSAVSVEALRAHPRISQTVVDRSREGTFRPLQVYRTARALGPHDLALSFRGHFYSKLLLALTGSPRRYLYDKKRIESLREKERGSSVAFHQVERYQRFVETILGEEAAMPARLRLDWEALRYPRPTLGINPGASYGSAKRWYPEKFAEVAVHLADRFDIRIFGGPGEVDIATDIEKMIRERGVENVQNLAGKTTVPELCSALGGLDLFLTGDSGPMHIAAAYRVPTVAVFGPTRWRETSQWKNPHSRIVRHDLSCAPCMKRSCPLRHHDCMKGIEASEVLAAAHSLLSGRNPPPESPESPSP